MALSCEYAASEGEDGDISLNGDSAENNIGPLIIFRRSSFAAMPTQAAIYQGL